MYALPRIPDQKNKHCSTLTLIKSQNKHCLNTSPIGSI